MNQNFFLKASCSLIICYEINSFILYKFPQKAIAQHRTFAEIAIEQSDIITSTDSSDTGNTNQGQTDDKPKLPDRGIPTGRRRGGTSRNECSELDRTLIAIVPGKETEEANRLRYSSSSGFDSQTRFSDSESFLTRTLEEYPSFWVYIPELPNFSQKAEFILQDEGHRDIYRAFFALPSRSGIINIELPSQPQNSLKIGQKYHWYVKIFCGDEKEKSGYIFVDAWIERIAVTPELERQLNNENANRYEILIENNIWHDGIDYLAEVRQNSLKNERWNELLTDLGLSDLIDKSVLDIRANFLSE